MVWQFIIPAVAGALASNKASKSADKATDASNAQAAEVNKLEREKFEYAKLEAEKLRAAGNEAAAVAIEEGARAELGAQRFEELSSQVARQFVSEAKRADDQAALKQRYARDIYEGTRQAANARQSAGQDAKTAIQAASGALMGQAGATDARITGAMNQGRADITGGLNRGTAYIDDAFGNINERFQPFVQSEQGARGQMDVELGLVDGEGQRTYRDSPAYSAVMDASRVAEEEGLRTIDQAAGNAGNLYSGSRGAALADRTRQASWERAGVEQSYFQNYMTMLQQMANPTSTNAVSGYESGAAGSKATLEESAAARMSDIGMSGARSISDAYMSAAGTGVNAEMAAQGVGLDSMRTGMEGSDLLQHVATGTEGLPALTAAASTYLNGLNPGTAGSPYRMGAQDYQVNAANAAAGLTIGNMPTGINSASLITSAANNSAASKNAMLADLVGAGANIYSGYMQSQTNSPAAPNYVSGQTNPKYPYMA